MNNYIGLVSVVMPCFNSESTIKRAIESVLNQSYPYLELLIVNDFSQDSTKFIISEFCKIDNRIRFFNNDFNIGVAMSRNIGIENSIGKFLAFCDSDDFWCLDKIEKQLRVIENYNIVCSNYKIVYNDSLDSKVIEGPEFIFKSLLFKSNFIPNSSGIYNVEVLGKVYQKKIGAEDYLMWLELAKRNNFLIYRVQEVLMEYTKVNNSLSSNKFKSAYWTWNIYYNEMKFSFFKSVYYFLFYLFVNFRKHLIK
jgi:glycosyltransferase involved in cell wall biosynthesis